MGLVVALAMVVVILKEEVLVCAVSSKGNAGDTEAREESSETVHSAEGTGVPPCLTAERERVSKPNQLLKGKPDRNILASPGVSSGVSRLGRGRGLEFADVESGGVASRHDGRRQV